MTEYITVTGIGAIEGEVSCPYKAEYAKRFNPVVEMYEWKLLSGQLWPIKKVLVVDDDGEWRKEIIKVLRDCGFNDGIIEAGNGQEGIEAANKYIFSLITMDWCMEPAGGEEAIKKIRERGITTPILVVSCFCSEETRRKAEALGVEVIEKTQVEELLPRFLQNRGFIPPGFIPPDGFIPKPEKPKPESEKMVPCELGSAAS